MKLGSDPEVFVKDKDGKLISIVGLVTGTKEKPWQIPGLPVGFTLQQDNVSLEFGIPPAANKEDWVRYLTQVKIAGKKILGLSYVQSSCEVFPEDQMQTAESRMFGCEPDFNAWTGEENPKPKPPHEFMRSAGGHVHIETALKKDAVIRAMDCFLGVPSLIRDSMGGPRRQLYGKAGAYRPKPYGVEYRTLSNFWLFKTQHMMWVWDQTEKALNYVSKFGDFDDERARYAIDTNNVALAKALIKEYQV